MAGDDRELVDALRERVRGAVLAPGEEGYGRARTVWNARVDREPAAIVRATGAADVLAAVEVARAADRHLSVKGGGHHVSGAALVDGGVTVDLGGMDGVRVDPRARLAHVGGGATWGDVDHETQAFGLAVPGGQDPGIGVGGLTLGGGVGWLSRRYGLTCDNLLGADVVTAGGELVRASEEEHPELLWGLRGGGGGLGIVTEFTFRLHPVGTEVLAGSLAYPLEAAGGVLRRYRSFVEDAPREVRPLVGVMELPAASYYPTALHGERVVLLLLCYCGDPAEGEAVLEPLRSFGEPLLDSVRRRPYVAWQRAGESAEVARTDLRSQYLPTLTDGAVETVVEHAAAAPSAGATAFVSPRGGAECDPAPDATAFAHREPAHHVLVEARWSDPDRDDEHVGWVRAFHEALRPFAAGGPAVNFLAGDEPDERVRAAFGGNYGRLAELKAAWDPENRLGGPVEPAG